MQSNDDQGVKVKFIPKLQRRSCQPVEGNDAATDQNVNQANHYVTKRKSNKLRLKFKSQSKFKFKKADFKNNEVEHDLNTEDDYEFIKPEKVQENRKTQTEYTSKPRNIQEYGPSIGGYRFIAFCKEDLIDYDEVKLNKKASIHSGYFENPGYVSEPESESESKLNSYKESSAYDYGWYCNLWKIIENGDRLEKIPLPLGSNNPAELNEVLVWEFLKYEKNVRLERIRWHPDKMMIKLKKIGMLSEDAEKMITCVFQIINRIYEDYCLSKQK